MLPILFFGLGVVDLVLAVVFHRQGKTRPAAFLAVAGVLLGLVAGVLSLTQRPPAP